VGIENGPKSTKSCTETALHSLKIGQSLTLLISADSETEHRSEERMSAQS
jgi:hypothetical protein